MVPRSLQPAVGLLLPGATQCKSAPLYWYLVIILSHHLVLYLTSSSLAVPHRVVSRCLGPSDCLPLDVSEFVTVPLKGVSQNRTHAQCGLSAAITDHPPV